MHTFRYSPLADPRYELRLIEVLPYDEDGYLSVVMSTVSTASRYDSAPVYRALSYAWGDGASAIPILLNGSVFYIGPSLETALRCLRNAIFHSHSESLEDLPLWVDQICINQEDLVERQEQVRKMGAIYSMAKEVIMWLGNHIESGDSPEPINDEPSERALGGLEGPASWTQMSLDLLDHLQSCHHEFEFFYKLQRFWQREHDTSPPSSKPTSFDPIRARDLTDQRFIVAARHLSRLFHRPWFQRLWVVQELELAASAIILWGTAVFSWRLLHRAAEIMLTPGRTIIPARLASHFSSLGAESVKQVAPFATSGVQADNILTLLHHTQNSLCGDPKDRLFAIIALANEGGDVVVDYAPTVEQVYYAWAVRRVDRTKNLDILSACANSRLSTDLPTWVPELRQPFGQDVALWGYCHYKPVLWSARGPQVPIQIIGATLHIQGCHLSNITSLSSTAVYSSRSAEHRSSFKNSASAFSIFESLSRWLAAHRTCKYSTNVCSSICWEGAYTYRALRRTVCREYVKENPTPTANQPLPYFRDRANYHDVENWLQQEIHDESAKNSTTSQQNSSHRSCRETYFQSSWESRFMHSWRYREWFLDKANEEESETKLLLGDRNKFEGWLGHHMNGCQLFLTDRRYDVGIIAGNCRAEVGDEIWLLDRALTPVILRSEGQNKKVIGPCYMSNDNGNVMGFCPLEAQLDHISII